MNNFSSWGIVILPPRQHTLSLHPTKSKNSLNDENFSTYDQFENLPKIAPICIEATLSQISPSLPRRHLHEGTRKVDLQQVQTIACPHMHSIHLQCLGNLEWDSDSLLLCPHPLTNPWWGAPLDWCLLNTHWSPQKIYILRIHVYISHWVGLGIQIAHFPNSLKPIFMRARPILWTSGFKLYGTWIDLKE